MIPPFGCRPLGHGWWPGLPQAMVMLGRAVAGVGAALPGDRGHFRAPCRGCPGLPGQPCPDGASWSLSTGGCLWHACCSHQAETRRRPHLFWGALGAGLCPSMGPRAAALWGRRMGASDCPLAAPAGGLPWEDRRALLGKTVIPPTKFRTLFFFFQDSLLSLVVSWLGFGILSQDSLTL